ncbi:MAG: hypothetical protein AABZ56_02205 [Bacteroidota bacterium]
MSRREKLSLFIAVGFLIIWILDLNSPTPKEIQGLFWQEIGYHYSWLMFAVGCLFYYQFARNERMANKDKHKKK